MRRAVMSAAALAVVLAAGPAPAERKEPGPSTVVFVCLHGNVKSLIASRWFERLAAERGVAVRVTSRGLEPENPVPPAIAERLASDGFDVRGFEARPFVPADLEGASRVVLIGAEAPAWAKGDARVVRWDGIPPTSESYEACRDGMRDRMGSLLESLARPRTQE